MVYQPEVALFWTAHSSSWLRNLASLFVTTTSSCAARSTIAFLFCVETLWAISAQYVLDLINMDGENVKSMLYFYWLSWTTANNITKNSTPKGGEKKTKLIIVNNEPVVHHQEFQLLHIVHHKLLETIGEIMAGLLIRTITNIRHQSNSLELPPNPRINTLGPTPVRLSQNAISRIRYDQSGELSMPKGFHRSHDKTRQVKQ